MSSHDRYAFLRNANPISEYLRHNGVKMRNGKFSCVNPSHEDKTPSASIFDNDQKWRCHTATCDCGGDIIDLVMLHRGVEHAEAVRLLGGGSFQDPPPVPPKKGTKPQLVRDFGPPPEDAPTLKQPVITLRSKKGKDYRKAIDHIYPYRDRHGRLVAYVGRVDAKGDDGKEIFPLRWHMSERAFMQAGFQKGELRPLMNEDQLAQRPEAEVLLVEGEKCVLIASALLPEMVVVTWMGGGGQVQDADFSSLKGRDVTLWRDNDAEGAKAMDIAGRKADAASLKSVPMQPQWPQGFDLADLALTPGAVHAALATRLTHRFDISPKGRHSQWAFVSDGGWLPDGSDIIFKPDGRIKPGASVNAMLALLYHPDFQTLHFDLLQQQVIWQDKPLTEPLFHLLQGRLFTSCGLDIENGFESTLVRAAMTRAVNTLADKMRRLPWDGVERVFRLFTYFGIPHSPWAVIGPARWFLGHTARILNPGTKQDLVLVLEAPQGWGKSTALKILGEAFGHNGYTRLNALGSGKMNDSDLMLIAGKTVVELGEMTALRRAELDHFKDMVTRDFDEYRVPYARDVIKVRRTASFVGTTNFFGDYLTDPTGARRFVPVACELPIDLDGLEHDREQLYAEAVQLLDQGEPSYFSDAEEALQAVEVEKRQQVGYITAQLQDLIEKTSETFLAEGLLWEQLAIPASSARERKQVYADMKTAMLGFGWLHQRIRTELGLRTWGFTKIPKRPGRPAWKRQLQPRS
jgi:putative DNA primase/helicase